MNSDITLASRVGAGSAFTFELALDFEADEDDSAVESGLEAPVIIGTDNAVLAYSLKQQLLSLGASSVMIAKSVDEACGALAAIPDALFFGDHGFASENAMDLSSRAARAFVLLSVLERNQINTMADMGFDGYFIKPLRQASLQKRLSSVADAAPADTTAHVPGTSPNKSPVPDEMAPSNGGRGNNGVYKVLLAEDNRVNAVLATTIIKRAGHQVDVAVNGVEAVAAVQAQSYDVVLMDMHMPEMDGLEATQAIRTLGKTFERLPIVALTASAYGKDRDRCLDAGMDDFLTKPFEPIDLTAILDKWVGKGTAVAKAS